jgi:integrase
MHVLAELQRWATRFPEREPSHFVFPAHRVGQGGSYETEPSQPIGSWKTAWSRARRVAGVKVRFHDLRHTACTRMLEGGVPLSVVATIMGWSAATTATMGKRYGHIGDAARRSAVQILESGGKTQGTGHKIGHNWTTAENAGPTSH